jgi:2',3'-cyclic-nucleotide 2'-phosphodiesterase (5'-nucleotidase family)
MSRLLTILHSGDVHSAFQPWCRLESIARRLRAELGPDCVVRLDTGDHASRTAHLTEATRGAVNIALLAAAGVDAFVPGENETLDWPVVQQVQLAREAPFSILGANLRLINGNLPPGVTDRAVLSRSGLRVGLFGLRPEVSAPEAHLGLVSQAAEDVAAEAIRELRLDGCDLVICLSHLGYQANRELAAAVRGIDVIVGGHSHLALTDGEQVGSTVLVHAGSGGDYLGRLDLSVAEGRILSWQSTLLPTAGEEPDSETVALLHKWETEAEDRLAEVVAYPPYPVPH